jgi:phosphatidylglycerol:prolipoprotein diacylglycerol transferase
VGALFLLGYGLFRFLVEFAREPDRQLGFVALHWMSMGQVLCLPMILFGAGWLIWSYRKSA